MVMFTTSVTSRDLSGIADPQVRFAVNLIGGPALRPLEFSRHKPETTLGASLTVSAPFGQYDPSRLINLGTNRWAFKPELGISQPVGDWAFEFYAGVWLFTDNNDFFGGQVKRQDPLASYQVHVVYTVRPRLWAAVDFTYYAGGSTTVNGRAQQRPAGQYPRRRDPFGPGDIAPVLETDLGTGSVDPYRNEL